MNRNDTVCRIRLAHLEKAELDSALTLAETILYFAAGLRPRGISADGMSFYANLLLQSSVIDWMNYHRRRSKGEPALKPEMSTGSIFSHFTTKNNNLSRITHSACS